MDSDNPFSFDVFLSHNSKDKARVRRLAERLQAERLRVWFDEWIIKPGDDIYLAIERGLEAARVQVLCLSPAALGSDWVGLERSTVLFRDPSNDGRRFIPLLLADCNLPDTLRRYKYVDFRKETDVAFAELLTACRGADEQAVSSEEVANGNPELMGRAQEHRMKPPEPRMIANGKKLQQEPLVILEHEILEVGTWVADVAIAPNSTWAVSGSMAGVRVWDLETGKCLATLLDQHEDQHYVSITSSGKQILSGSPDGIVRLWDGDSKRLLKEIKTFRPIGCIAAVPGDLSVLVGGAQGKFELWDMESTQRKRKFRGHEEYVTSIALTEDGKRAITASHDESLKVWDIKESECLYTLHGHGHIAESIRLTPDGRHAITGSGDNTIKIWDLDAKNCIETLEGHTSKIDSVAVSPNGALLASTGYMESEIRIWDWKTGSPLQVIKLIKTPLSVAFSPDGKRLVVGTSGSLLIYRVTDVGSTPAVEVMHRYVNAKVVLVGESAVGKTTLAHRLIEDRYVKTDSTHGMNVWRLDLPIEPDEGREREALLWDLAGQEDYRLIHQLYLEETALALLLINPQRNDPFAEAGDWLNALRAAFTDKKGREVAKLLIPTRLDVGGLTVSQQKIERFLKENDFVDCLATSAKRGDNCSDKKNGNRPSKLKHLIAQHIPWDKLPSTSTPRLLAAIKNSVVAMRDEADIRLLRFAELAQRIEQALPKEKITEPDVRTGVTLLANHGLVRPLKFGDLVLLRPDLLNGYAAAIIRAARMHKDEIGCVAEESIYGDDFDFTGVERLKHRPDEDLLLRALVQTLLDYSLCIRETEGGKTLLIFPSQYRRDRDIPGHPEILVSYTFSGELQTIYTTLVVRAWYSHTFGQKELWQNAAEFTTSKGQCAGVVFQKLGDGVGKLSIFFEIGVPDELKVVFIEFVHRHLQKYGRDLQRERRYVCPNHTCGEPVENMEAVQKRMKAGKDFIVCQICDEPVPFKDHIEERLGSDPVAREVVAMDERARQALDTQALEQILTGHMQAICGEANQIFRELTKFDYGIDGEVEFKDGAGKASGKKIYVQLKSGASYLRKRKVDRKEIFDVKDTRHLEYWVSQPVDVYLVIRDSEETIRWMNLTRYLKSRKDKQSRQIVFEGEKLSASAVWRIRDGFFPPDRSIRAGG